MFKKMREETRQVHIHVQVPSWELILVTCRLSEWRQSFICNDSRDSSQPTCVYPSRWMISYPSNPNHPSCYILRGTALPFTHIFSFLLILSVSASKKTLLCPLSLVFSSINQLFFLLFSSLFSVLLQQLIDAAIFCKTSNTSPLCCIKKTANKLTVSQPKTAAPLLLKVAEKSSLYLSICCRIKKRITLLPFDSFGSCELLQERILLYLSRFRIRKREKDSLGKSSSLSNSLFLWQWVCL